jgi:hypothetical protein
MSLRKGCSPRAATHLNTLSHIPPSPLFFFSPSQKLLEQKGVYLPQKDRALLLSKKIKLFKKHQVQRKLGYYNLKSSLWQKGRPQIKYPSQRSTLASNS